MSYMSLESVSASPLCRNASGSLPPGFTLCHPFNCVHCITVRMNRSTPMSKRSSAGRPTRTPRHASNTASKPIASRLVRLGQESQLHEEPFLYGQSTPVSRVPLRRGREAPLGLLAPVVPGLQRGRNQELSDTPRRLCGGRDAVTVHLHRVRIDSSAPCGHAERGAGARVPLAHGAPWGDPPGLRAILERAGARLRTRARRRGGATCARRRRSADCGSTAPSEIIYFNRFLSTTARSGQGPVK